MMRDQLLDQFAKRHHAALYKERKSLAKLARARRERILKKIMQAVAR